MNAALFSSLILLVKNIPRQKYLKAQHAAFSDTFWPGKATATDGGDDVDKHDNAQSHPNCQLHVLPPTRKVGISSGYTEASA